MKQTISEIEALLQKHGDSLLGIFSASIVLLLWGGSLIWLFRLDLATVPVWAIVAIFLARMFLHTGLFITAHDAMHGSACPTIPKLNNFIGVLALATYALLPYNIFLEKHRMHHRNPATEKDPDFCQKSPNNPVLWYLNFMFSNMKYKYSWVQLVAMTVLFHSLRLVVHIPTENVLLIWALPMVFSSAQMFYFGVFLPHRKPEEGYLNSHRSQSSYYSEFWSFLTCYHFGYHWEHHEFPHLPWYKLPSAIES